MFTPIGFFAPQGAAGFDPSLGGTLSTLYWWDFTDSSTMTLSGTDIDDITDKYGSLVMEDMAEAGASAPQWDSVNEWAVFDGGNPGPGLWLGSSTLPSGMTNTDTFTIVGIGKSYDSANSFGIMYGLQTTVGNGFGSLSMNYWGSDPPVSYSNQLCTTHGTGRATLIRWFESGNKTIYTKLSSGEIEAMNMLTLGHDGSGGAKTVYLGYNDANYDDAQCSRSMIIAKSGTSGFHIGNAFSSGGPAKMHLRHVIVYDQLLSDAQKNALWAAYETI
jgi:hypothetical protein